MDHQHRHTCQSPPICYFSKRFRLPPLNVLHLTQNARWQGDENGHMASSMEEAEMELLARVEHTSWGFGIARIRR